MRCISVVMHAKLSVWWLESLRNQLAQAGGIDEVVKLLQNKDKELRDAAIDFVAALAKDGES